MKPTLLHQKSFFFQLNNASLTKRTLEIKKIFVEIRNRLKKNMSKVL